MRMRQFLRTFLMHGLIMMNGGMPAISWCIGLKRPWPPGMPKDECWILPAIFWDLLRESFCCFRIDVIILKFSFAFLEVVGWYNLFH